MKRLNSVLLLMVLVAMAASLVYAATWRFPVTEGLTIGDLIYCADSAHLGNIADVATGQVLMSGGVGAAPNYSASPTLTGITSTYRGLTPSQITPTGTATYSLVATGISLVYLNNVANYEVTVSETGAVNGQELEIVNCSSGTAGFSDSAGVLELGAASRVLGVGDILRLRYVVYPWSGGTNAWLENGFYNN